MPDTPPSSPSSPQPPQPPQSPGTAAAVGTGDKGTRVRIRVDDRNLSTNYTNAFRSNSTAEEVIVDFGLDLVTQPPDPNDPQKPAEVMFQITNRMIMNYFTAKRLAITLAQVVREHEQAHGEITVAHGGANTERKAN